MHNIISIEKRQTGAFCSRCLKTDHEDNKMKKDTLATLQDNDSNNILRNLHQYISIVLNKR